MLQFINRVNDINILPCNAIVKIIRHKGKLEKTNRQDRK